MTIYFENEIEQNLNWCEYEELIRRVVKQALKQEECPYEVELNISLTDNLGIKEINQEFRNIDTATDVLSFPMISYKKPADFHLLKEEKEAYFNMETGELILGDIVISVEKAEEQAEEYGHTIEREIAFLIAHSMLHLFGYDHMEDGERVVMEKRQKAILESLNIRR